MLTRASILQVANLMMAALALAACASVAPKKASNRADAVEEVRSTERGFAQTMADRNFESFSGYLSADAIFFDGKKTLHGVSEVSAAWKPLFADAKAPFSWAPDHVEVLASG